MPSGGRLYSDFCVVPVHICISSHIPVVSVCLSIGQTSPVKSLKPVSKNISFALSSLSLPHGNLSRNLISKLFVLQLNQ